MHPDRRIGCQIVFMPMFWVMQRVRLKMLELRMPVVSLDVGKYCY
jgi:hypothetical protein